MKSRVATIRAMGYEGPLTLAVMHAASQCYVLHLLAYKNMASRLEMQQAIGGIRYVLCRPVSALLQFFVRTLRPLLEPKEKQPLVFVQVVGERRGACFDANKDGFGRYCGQPNGLNIGTSVRTVRHVVTTEAVRCLLVKPILLLTVFFAQVLSYPGNSGPWRIARTCVRQTCTPWRWPMSTISTDRLLTKR